MLEKAPQYTSVEPGMSLLQAEKTGSLSLMASGVSHDFNNHLAAILGNTAILAKSLPPDSALQKNLKQIDLAARKALELTNQLQTCAGKGEFKLESIQINLFINDLAPKIGESVHAGINLQYILQKDIPEINADPLCLAHVIINLVCNASDAMLDRQGTITISTGRKVNDHIRRDEDCMEEIRHGENYVYVEVKDEGCGITGEVRSKIFDPFFTTKIRGHGMGLPIVLGIMRAHGGGIEIQTTPGKGSTFSALFPSADQ